MTPRDLILKGIQQYAEHDAVRDFHNSTPMRNPYKRADYRKVYETDYRIMYNNIEESYKRLSNGIKE